MTILELIRAERGVTTRDLATAAGRDHSAIIRAERRGIRTYSTAARYAAAINKLARRRGLALAEITPHMLIDIPETLPPKRDGKHYTY
ncbi:MAG: hypothetical protein PHI85_03930 [Victivallaceae bacterium]|nr:hypothetical protein [Victivallaceae bacterium]